MKMPPEKKNTLAIHERTEWRKACVLRYKSITEGIF